MVFVSGTTETPIIPVLIVDFRKTLLFWRKLFDAGVFTNPVVPPALPPSRCRLRTSVMATHSADQIDYALETFGRDRKSTRLNSSHGYISYAVFCLKKKKNKNRTLR